MASYTTTYRVGGVHSGHCKAIVSKALRDLETVNTVQIEISTGLLTLDTAAEPDDTLVETVIEDAGYDYLGRA
ncbi:heavy-metal-associated domain-containing protein [Streptomyces qinzhouensis]|uniref:Heavy-metal-associated domain-containing protein n=1 Tax=Streptomyces qinzhouensis TaxID=2599401 RepID=A0A5B8IM39_9ACTN|nr:heavy-metal-associated domain-containing protein [Streptomyces qinzhouensis]QDY79668.1 heavy-metal-associated domain-containing protein [Streptomyces qinzhouensis]